MIKKSDDNRINDGNNKLLQSFGSANYETIPRQKKNKNTESGMVIKSSIEGVVNDKEWVDYGSRL